MLYKMIRLRTTTPVLKYYSIFMVNLKETGKIISIGLRNPVLNCKHDAHYTSNRKYIRCYKNHNTTTTTPPPSQQQ